MKIEINIDKKAALFLASVIIVVTIVGLVVASNNNGEVIRLQAPTPNPGHDADAIGPGTIAGTLTITDTGEVGIGTTNPQSKLDVYNGSIKTRDTTSEIQIASGFIEMLLPAASNPWEHAFIDFKDTAGEDHDVRIHHRNAYDLAIYSSQSPNTVKVGIGHDAADPTDTLTIRPGGTTLADAWTPRSSKRWKTNIKPITGALEKLMGLSGVYFDWKESGKQDVGMIAEEVGEVIPEVVSYEENGKDAKSLDYDRLVAVLVEAIKEQQTQIEGLKEIVCLDHSDEEICQK